MCFICRRHRFPYIATTTTFSAHLFHFVYHTREIYDRRFLVRDATIPVRDLNHFRTIKIFKNIFHFDRTKIKIKIRFRRALSSCKEMRATNSVQYNTKKKKKKTENIGGHARNICENERLFATNILKHTRSRTLYICCGIGLFKNYMFVKTLFFVVTIVLCV